ncbi:MAG TPA: fibronectin type III domain-containing protein [Desulfuromonadales bacterium]|nr:fibronectin type III domain-containing protein [Desulfuromonadales bacterium]
MHTFIKRTAALALLACLPLLFAACGGGGGGDAAVETTTISGEAIKGPIKGALVQVFKLNSDGTTGELLGNGTTATDASYSIQIPKAKAVAPLLVKVTGQTGAAYTSESTGSDVPFGAVESFSAALDAFDTSKKYIVSPLTEAAYQQVQKFLTDSPTSKADQRIISAANARIAMLFNVSDILADPASDPSYSATLKLIDQMIVDSGAATTIQTMSMINQAFADVTQPAYQIYRTALTAAATKVSLREPAIASIVNAILATAANPPAEPVWSDTTAPHAVTDLKAVAGADTATTSVVTLTWNPATTTGKNPVTGYSVYRDGTLIASVATTSYTDKPLVPSTTYNYYVIAFDAAGNRSVASAEITVTTPVSPNLSVTVGGQLTSDVLALEAKDIFKPTAPTNLVAAPVALDATNSSVKLTWSAASDDVGVTGYNVYRNGTKIGSATVPSYTDPSVKSGVAYSYTVVAFDAAGNLSDTSTAISVTPVSPNLDITIDGQINTSSN